MLTLEVAHQKIAMKKVDYTETSEGLETTLETSEVFKTTLETSEVFKTTLETSEDVSWLKIF